MPTQHFVGMHNYSLLVFSLAALAIGLKQLLSLNTLIANVFAAISLFIGGSVIVLALVHYWRHG